VINITLNLLPPHLIRQRAAQRRGRNRVVLAAAAVLPFVLAYGIIHARTQVLRFRSTVLSRQIGAITPLALKARKLDSDLAGLKQREDALTGLTTRVPRWSSALVDLRDALPPDAWLTSMSITAGQLTVVGQAQTETAVSAVTTGLASARFLSGASLKYVKQQDAGGGRRVYTFEIDATLRGDGGP
jgi:Tfp pilus assembly protein PilN